MATINSPIEDRKQHFLTYPFALRDQTPGGLPTIILDAARKNQDKKVTVFSTDITPGKMDGINIHPVDLNPDAKTPFKLWFETGMWTLLHPAAFTAPAIPSDVLKEMYPLNDNVSASAVADVTATMQEAKAATVETVADLNKYVERYAPPLSEAKRFCDRFNRHILAIPDGACMHYQDYMSAESVIACASPLRARGVFQTLHLFTNIPDTLYQTEMGRRILLAASMVDTVYTLAATYNDKIAIQLRAMGMPVPQFKVFELGIDQTYIDQALSKINSANYRDTIPNFESLSSRQKGFLDDVYKTKNSVPNRFLVADRPDPGKGITTVQDAVNEFLSTRGMSTDQLRANYRFFFLHPGYSPGSDLTKIADCYAHYVIKQHEKLMDKYPGVVHVSEGFGGEHRIALASVMDGMHGVTGGTQDGFNIIMMENSYINRNNNTGLICGRGAGFAIEAESRGLDHAVFFVEPGDSRRFREAFELTTKAAAKQELIAKKIPVVKWVESRNGSTVIVDRES